MVSAGRGYSNNHTEDEFATRAEEACEKKGVAFKNIFQQQAEVVVGASLCGVELGSTDHGYLHRVATRADSVAKGGPMVRMKGDYFWAAFYQAQAEARPGTTWPERGISWREFRILCAILSVERNRANFAFIGWETIQARAHGFTTKEAFRTADNIPDHLAPPLTHKMIRPILERLENLGFYARFRFSKGKTGGYMAYSVRHTKEELGDAVCDFVNFKDRAGIKANREADAKKCLETLERAKVGQRVDKQ